MDNALSKSKKLSVSPHRNHTTPNHSNGINHVNPATTSKPNLCVNDSSNCNINVLNNHCNKSEWVKLNVGGTTFLTTKTTLSKDPESVLSKLVNEDMSNVLTDGKVRYEYCVH